MATSLGSLVVSLGLNAADYTAGLTKAELQAQRFSKSVSNSFKAIGGILAGLSIGTELVSATQDIIASAAALNDLSDATGSSVESLSRLSNQAQIAGADFGELEAVMLKLSVALSGADEEGSKAGKAFKLLGVTSRDPAEALQQMALGLNKFADGADKAGLAAAALGGKVGPRFLATLKDIAELQDVAATTTKKQAAEAEELEKAYRRLTVEGTIFKNLVLSGIVPALLDIIKTMRDGTDIAGGFWEAVFSGMFSSFPGESLDETIARTNSQMEELKKSVADPGFFMRPFVDANIKEIERLEKKLAFLTKTRDRRFLDSVGGPPTNEGSKPAAPKLPKDDKGEAKKTLEQHLREIDNFVKAEEDTLRDRESFLQSYYQDDQLGLRDYFAGRRAAMEEAAAKEVAAFDKQAELLRAFAAKAKPAERIEAETKLADVLAKRGRLQQQVATDGVKLWIDEAKAVKAFQEQVEKASITLAEMRGDTVTAALAGFDLANKKFATMLAELKKSANPEDQNLAAIGERDLAATRALVGLRAQLNKETETYSQTLEELGIAQANIANLETVGAINATEAFDRRQQVAARFIDKLKEELRLLEETAAKSGLREDAIRAAKMRLELETIITEKIKEQKAAMQDFQNFLADSFANTFEDFIMGTKSASQAFKDFANDIERYLLKIALHKLGDQMFGGATSGSGDLFGSFFKAIMGMFGGSGIQSVNGFQGFGTFAAKGTNFAFGGPTMVGENGPEVVDMPRGARVWPNGTGPKAANDSAIQIENHFHVNGTINSATVRQIERGVGDSVMRNRMDR